MSIIKECRRCYKRYGTWTGAEILKDFGFCRTCLKERQELRGNVPRSVTGRKKYHGQIHRTYLEQKENFVCAVEPDCFLMVVIFGVSANPVPLQPQKGRGPNPEVQRYKTRLHLNPLTYETVR